MNMNEQTEQNSSEPQQQGHPKNTAEFTGTKKERWSVHADEATGYAYYYDNETGESQWERPGDFGDDYADQTQQLEQYHEQPNQQLQYSSASYDDGSSAAH